MARSSAEATNAVRKRLEAYERATCSGFAVHVFNHSRLTSVECWGIEIDPRTGDSVAGKDASVIIEHEVDIDSSMVNQYNTVHGGYLATLLDSLSSSAVAALARGSTWETSGVSTDINIHFLNPGQLGSTLRIISKTLKQGSRLSVIDIRAIDKGTGKTVMVGSHTKADIISTKTAKL